MNNINKILEDRCNTHGHFSDNARTTQRFKEVLRSTRNWNKLPDEIKEAFDNVCSKMSRACNGDYKHPDHYDDIKGYSTLGADSIKNIRDY